MEATPNPLGGLEPFRRQTVNDTVEYFIFVLNQNRTANQVRSRLAEVKAAATTLEKTHLREYIWHKDKFEPILGRDLDRWTLSGSTNVGDSVADEWLIVWILRELSIRFDDVWIRAHDSDGEFLAIEAADNVPKWLTPENDANRIWIHNGRVVVIPVSSHLPPELSLSGALEHISSRANPPLHSSPELDTAAFSRIARHPQSIKENVHRSTVTVPRKLAFLLLQRPKTVSAAIEAFHLRDPVSMRSLRRQPGRSLRFPPSDLVDISLVFSRVGYAQIRTQEFAPPASWFEVHRAMNGQPISEESTLQQRRLEVGMKLTCGFEMLLASPTSKARKDVRELELLLEDLEQGEDALPSDDTLSKNLERAEESEKWMEVDWNDFEQALNVGAGDHHTGDTQAVAAQKPHGKNTTKAAENPDAPDPLQTLLSRTKAFMEDSTAGLEGVDDRDEMDIDNDSDVAWSDRSSGGDSSDQIDEDAFNSTLREVVTKPLYHHAAAGTGRPAFGPDPPPGSKIWHVKTVVPSEWARIKREMRWQVRGESGKAKRAALEARFRDTESSDTALFEMTKSRSEASHRHGQETKTFEQRVLGRKMGWREEDDASSDGADYSVEEAEQMERELREAGALNIDAPPTTSTGKGKGRAGDDATSEGADAPDSDEYRILSNLLESLSAEGGAPGPSRNLMKMLGVDVPHDDDQFD